MMFRMYIVSALALTTIGADVIKTITNQGHVIQAVTGKESSAVPGSRADTPPSLELKLSTFLAKDSGSGPEVEVADAKSRSLLQPPGDGPAVRTEDINGIESAFTSTQQTGFPNPGFRNNFTRPEGGVAAQILNRFSRGSARHIPNPKDQTQQDIIKDLTKRIEKDGMETVKPLLSIKSNTPNLEKRKNKIHKNTETSNIESTNEQANKKVAIIRTQIPFSLESDHGVTAKGSNPVVFKQGRQLWTYLEPVPLRFYNFNPSTYSIQELIQISHPLSTFQPTVVELINDYVPLNNIKIQDSGNNMHSSLSLKSVQNSLPPSIYLPSIPLNTISLQSVSNSVPINTVSLQSVGHSVPFNTVTSQSGDYSIPLHSVPMMTSVNVQHQSNDKLGNYEYGYSNSLSAKYESRSLDGVTRGAYSYVDPYGVVQSVNYEADNLNGFRVMATNLPLAPKL